MPRPKLREEQVPIAGWSTVTEQEITSKVDCISFGLGVTPSDSSIRVRAAGC